MDHEPSPKRKAKSDSVHKRTKASEKDSDKCSLDLPEEIVVKIFQLVAEDEGAVPFLCRVARVCRVWNRAAACPSLWRSVSIGRGGTEPGTSQLSGMERKETVDWLAQERFSQLTEFSLFHCKSHVGYVVQKVTESSVRLQSLNLSHCKTVTMKAFESLQRCRSLERLNLQNSEFNVLGLVSFLKDHGTQIKSLCFTHGYHSQQILRLLYRGFCPELRLLEINTELDAEDQEIHICIWTLQIKCPKLQTFRLMNLTLVPHKIRYTPFKTPGFPLLEELSIPTNSDSRLSCTNLLYLLSGSPCLRVLDLRGAFTITCATLCCLPCKELECLYWGLNSKTKTFLNDALHTVAFKWRHTLRELDLTNQLFSGAEMSFAFQEMLLGNERESFCSLNLSGTRILSSTVRELISKAPGLKYLNLSSCRNLPNEHQRLYQGREDIQQLFEKLECQE